MIISGRGEELSKINIFNIPIFAFNFTRCFFKNSQSRSFPLIENVIFPTMEDNIKHIEYGIFIVKGYLSPKRCLLLKQYKQVITGKVWVIAVGHECMKANLDRQKITPLDDLISIDYFIPDSKITDQKLITSLMLVLDKMDKELLDEV